MLGWVGIGVLFHYLDRKNLCEIHSPGSEFPSDDCAWTFIDALYFAIITSTTIGYGDESPATNGGKIFALFYLPLTTVVLCGFVGEIANIPFERAAAKWEATVRSQFGSELTSSELRMLCKVDGDTCTFEQYVLAMLVKLGKIDQDDIDACREHFDLLDKDGDGSLTVEDLSDAEKASYHSGAGIMRTSTLAREGTRRPRHKQNMPAMLSNSVSMGRKAHNRSKWKAAGAAAGL